MRIAFVYPFFESLGIEYLSACLKTNGHSTKLFLDPMLFDGIVASNRPLDKLINFKKILIAEILEWKPDLICFSVVSDCYVWACETANRLRQESSAKIVFGGPHPTALPERVIDNDFVDFVIVGEGEYALLDLATYLERKEDYFNIMNVWCKHNGTVVKNQLRPLVTNLDTLAFPDKDLYSDYYKQFVKEIYLIMGSRGCPHACSYCYNDYMKRLYQGQNFLRRRSVDNIIEELISAKVKYNYKRVDFRDDLFIFDKEWLRELCTKFKKHINVPFNINAHPDYIDASVIEILEDAGCRGMVLGVQTISEELRIKKLNRRCSNENIVKTINLASKTKIVLFVDIIIGLPGQDKEELIKIAQFFNRHKVDFIKLFWLRYYPKTKMMDYLDAKTKEEIERGDCVAYFHRFGNSFSKERGKLANFILLSQALPSQVLDFFIDKKIYTYLLTTTFSTFYFIIRSFSKRVLGRKFAYRNFGIMAFIKFYSYFMSKWIRSTWRYRRVKLPIM